MRKLIPMLLLVLSLALPASALEIEAPPVLESGKNLMPQNTESLLEGLMELIHRAGEYLHPDLAEACQGSAAVIGVVMLISVLQSLSGDIQPVLEVAGVLGIAAILLQRMGAMIQLGVSTVRELSEYGKLLYPVMTTAMAAQGGVNASTALYVGTAVFDTLLGSLISSLLIPMLYLFLAIAAANGATGEEMLKQFRDLIRSGIIWCLKAILTVFTTYMSITGVVSGTTDAATLKATKITISSVVPAVGGILSDASEAILVSAGLMKNAAGIYGILAILSIFVTPFLRIAAHYLMLKATAAICGIFGTKRVCSLLYDISAAMGLLLAMTGTMCLLLLISTVCFLKGMG